MNIIPTVYLLFLALSGSCSQKLYGIKFNRLLGIPSTEQDVVKVVPTPGKMFNMQIKKFKLTEKMTQIIINPSDDMSDLE